MLVGGGTGVIVGRAVALGRIVDALVEPDVGSDVGSPSLSDLEQETAMIATKAETAMMARKVRRIELVT